MIRSVFSVGMLRVINYALSLFVSRFRFRRAKIIQMPFYIRNFGTLSFGDDFSSGPNLIIDVMRPDAELVFGINVKLYHRNHIAVMKSVLIGNDVLIASGVYISDHSHGSYSGSGPHSSPSVPPNARILQVRPVVIGDRVWIGENVSILPGVVIGEGSIIGANSVVLSSIPKNVIAVGCPARVVKRFCDSSERWVSVEQ